VDAQSIWRLITHREDAANTLAQDLRAQIAALTAQLDRVETELADLAITRSTLIALTGGEPDTATPDTTVASPAYQQILAVFTGATDAMRAKDVCLALGIGTTPKYTEALRAKLKRLVARQVLVEAQPGLFALAPATLSTQDHERTANSTAD
jgi:hypothetical protein